MMLKMGANALKTKMEERELDINWEDYNYPPGLKIIHYNPPELQDKAKSMVAHALHGSFLVITLFYIVNVTTNIIGVVTITEISFFMPLYSLFHMLMGVPLCMGIFSKGYRALAGVSEERTWYKYGEIFVLVITTLAFCFNMLCYHGIKMVFTKFRQEAGPIVFIFGLIEEILLLIQIILRGYAVGMILFKYLPEKPEE